MFSVKPALLQGAAAPVVGHVIGLRTSTGAYRAELYERRCVDGSVLLSLDDNDNIRTRKVAELCPHDWDYAVAHLHLPHEGARSELYGPMRRLLLALASQASLRAEVEALREGAGHAEGHQKRKLLTLAAARLHTRTHEANQALGEVAVACAQPMTELSATAHATFLSAARLGFDFKRLQETLQDVQLAAYCAELDVVRRSLQDPWMHALAGAMGLRRSTDWLQALRRADPL